MLDRLDAALDDGNPSPPMVFDLDQVARLHVQVMKIVARIQRLNSAAILATDFSRQRPRDPAWLAASRVRQLATYILVAEYGIRQAQAAAAIGVTKTAIGKTLAVVEDRRDEPGVARLIDRVTRQLFGD